MVDGFFGLSETLDPPGIEIPVSYEKSILMD
jgi:hypothetical protein